jgi:hypothetical protein
MLFAMVFLFCSFAFAETEDACAIEDSVVLGEDVILINHYNRVVYHESHPNFNKVQGNGGWVVGLTFDGFEPDVKYVRISGGSVILNKTKGSDIISLGEKRSSFVNTFGQKGQIPNNVQIKAWDLDGNPIIFTNTDGTTTNVLKAKPRKDIVLPPVCEIYNMKAHEQNDEINIFIKAPYDERAVAVKVFILKPGEVLASYVFDPPVKDKEQMKLCIPGEWSGYDASLVYVTLEKDETQYKGRGVVRFTLP